MPYCNFLFGQSNKNQPSQPKKDPETDYTIAHETVWRCIGGALQASQLYVGDKLGLYRVLRDACSRRNDSVTAQELATLTGLHTRWLQEWMAQQAAMGILTLLPSSGADEQEDEDNLRYRLPRATAEVLANPESSEYDISMIAMVPALVYRARTMLPEAFATGLGRPYDDEEITQAIDRQHALEIREIVLPKLIPAINDGKALAAMERGCKVADLGCGAGNLVRALAQRFPRSTIHGYEVSEQALSVGATKLLSSKPIIKNAFLINANDDPLGDHTDQYDVVVTFDVLHDAPNPVDLIQQVQRALKPGGVWILGDIPSRATVRENIEQNPKAATYLAFSTCLCMSCSMSTADGAGLGTLGFSVPVAQKMLRENGFSSVKVVLETPSSRWFQVML